MTLPEEILLGAEDEAQRLWKGSLDARKRADSDLVALCEAIDLGVRAAEILAIHKLQDAKEKFPATIVAQLEIPDPEVDVERDAAARPRMLRFSDVLDLLSAEELECVSPRLHRGWEDRRFSCRRSRSAAQESLGITLEREEREKLLLLSAYRNRIFRDPPPVRIRTADVLASLDPLSRFVERLIQTA